MRKCIKRHICVLLLVCMIIVLSACGKKAGSTETEKQEDNNSSDETTIIVKDNYEYTVDQAGTYILSGSGSEFTLTIDVEKEDNVQVVLDNVSIKNSDAPVIYIKSAGKCELTIEGNNEMSVSGEYASNQDANLDAVIFSKDDLVLSGTGVLTLSSPYGNGISGKDNVEINGGEYYITCGKDGLEANDTLSISDGKFVINAQSDGIHTDAFLVIDGGEFDITASEGLEATYIKINDGNINISASDDGINASAKSTEYEVVIEINGGYVCVSAGPGDTDCLDANGTIIINGGTVDVTGQSTFDYDTEAIYNGGTLVVNGVTVDKIPAAEMGGPAPGMGGPGRPGGNEPPDGNELPDGPSNPGGFIYRINSAFVLH